MIANHLKVIDGRDFYINMLDPNVNFNKTEITLSHLFRKKLAVLGNRNYSDCLFNYLHSRNILRPQIMEVGGGLGDVAFNLLNAARDNGYKINEYISFDISLSLLNAQKTKNGKSVNEYIRGDCLELSAKKAKFSGMLLSNGIIADLPSVYISREESLPDLGMNDHIIGDFLTEYSNNVTEGFYFHVGAIKFLREIYNVLELGSSAFISEYSASKLNQPSLFGNHYECGIDFSQIAAFAKLLGFETIVVDIEEILGFPRDRQFLTVDVFTSQDKIARRLPQSVKLWQKSSNLPVLAYTRDYFRETLLSAEMSFSPAEADELTDAFSNYFYSIHDPNFDTVNPTTWGYKCLLLNKTASNDWVEQSIPFAAAVLSDVYGISESDAEMRYRKSIEERTMGDIDLAQFTMEALLGGILFECVKYSSAKVLEYAGEKLIHLHEKGKVKDEHYNKLHKSIKKAGNKFRKRRD